MTPHISKTSTVLDEHEHGSTLDSGSKYTLSDSKPTVGQRTPSLKRNFSVALSDNTSDIASENDNIEECIASMIARRDQLRKRFKEWAEDVDNSAMRLRCITDNALVNQSVRLEKILGDGKARIDAIVGGQNKIREQLGSFVSMLSSAQAQVFGDRDAKFAGSESTATSAPIVKSAAKASLADKRQTNPRAAAATASKN